VWGNHPSIKIIPRPTTTWKIPRQTYKYKVGIRSISNEIVKKARRNGRSRIVISRGKRLTFFGAELREDSHMRVEVVICKCRLSSRKTGTYSTSHRTLTLFILFLKRFPTSRDGFSILLCWTIILSLEKCLAQSKCPDENQPFALDFDSSTQQIFSHGVFTKHTFPPGNNSKSSAKCFPQQHMGLLCKIRKAHKIKESIRHRVHPFYIPILFLCIASTYSGISQIIWKYKGSHGALFLSMLFEFFTVAHLLYAKRAFQTGNNSNSCAKFEKHRKA